MKKILFFVLTLTCAVQPISARKITIRNDSGYPVKVIKNFIKVIGEIDVAPCLKRVNILRWIWMMLLL